ncbi:ABC transporter permease [Nonomuraea sp. NPDC050663]|uniref:ABC transporter permease n=1 Tax=Nonomuraea sp. NPDC050663 TaxID=3364370 RepID=UPI0037A57BEF
MKRIIGALPLLVFTALALGIPAIAMVAGAFDRGMGNLALTMQGGYLLALLNSVKLSAVVAVLGAVLGTFLAQVVVRSRFREAVLTASGVLANFGGVPLAFFWVATLGNSGTISSVLGLPFGTLFSFWGLALVYLYFSIPLMVLAIAPALDGLRPQWREAAMNSGASTWHYWRYVALPVLTPGLLGGVVLLFGSAFAAYATAAAMGAGTVLPLITLKIAAALSGDVQTGYESVGLALALDMVVVAALVMVIYVPLQRRSTRWLQ